MSRADEIDREVARLEQRALRDPTGERYGRRLRGVPADSRPASRLLAYLLITALKTAADAAWTDFATDGYPYKAEGNPCNSAGESANASVTKTILLTPDSASVGCGVIPETSTVVAYLPIDGATEGIDGLVIPGVLGAAQFAKVIDD